MKKNILMMSLMAGALIFSSCASKKDLENCRLDNQSLQNENKELNTSYQVAKEQLAAANARLASLEEQLAQANADMDLLRLDINSLSKTVSSLQDENAEQRQTMEAQMAEANKAYYVVGTSRDLKEKGLLTGGGLLKKKKVNYESLNQALFTKIDIRNTTQFNIPSKKAKVLTDAPSDSYTITQNGNSCTLRITNVTRFWSISRYLIIQAD